MNKEKRTSSNTGVGIISENILLRMLNAHTSGYRTKIKEQVIQCLVHRHVDALGVNEIIIEQLRLHSTLSNCSKRSTRQDKPKTPRSQTLTFAIRPGGAMQ